MSEKEVLQSLLEAARGQITDLTAEVTNLASKLADAQAEVLSMHRRLASESLRADQGWERYENANCDRNSLRAAIAAPVVQVAGGDQHPAWSRMVLYTDTIGGNQTCRDDLWAITSGELRELLAAKVSARAADAPSEPMSKDLEWLIQCADEARFNPELATTLRNNVKNGIKYRAADALDSQPTVPVIMTTTERDGYEAGIANKADPNPYIDGSKFRTEWQRGFDAGRAECLSWDAPASSQPTDGEVRNG